MSVTLGSNIASLRAQRQLLQSSSRLDTVFERLSSGQRINRASDDAAGLAIVNTLDARVRVQNQALRNLNDGISLITITEGSLAELTKIVTRTVELAEQSANGTYSSEQRAALDIEAKALVDEYNRIIESTEFNGLKLLENPDLEIVLQGGVGDDNVLTVSLTDKIERDMGTGHFTVGAPFSAGNTTGSRDPYIMDINKDGIQDLVHANEFNDQVQIFYGTGGGNFSSANNSLVGNNPSALIVLDVNGDSNLDLVTANSISNDLSVRLGNGDGSFNPQVTYSIGAVDFDGTGLEAGDFNGDGISDLAVLNRNDNNISLMIGASDGSFALNSIIALPASISSSLDLSVADFNGNGKLDILVMNADPEVGEGLVFISGNGDGTFQSPLTTAGAALSSFAVGDINGDGHLDVVAERVVSLDSVVLLGGGDGTFTISGTYDLDIRGIRLADMNADGVLDIIGDLNDTVKVAFGNGDGTFEQPISTVIPGGINIGRVAVGDFSGDGVPDAFVPLNNSTAVTIIQETRPATTILAFDLSTTESSRQSLDRASALLSSIGQQIGSIGASRSRLESYIRNIRVEVENNQAAKERIIAADIALETGNLVKNNILRQITSSVLAQANQLPEVALLLLRE